MKSAAVIATACYWLVISSVSAETLVLRLQTAAPVEINLATGTKTGTDTPLEAETKDISIAAGQAEETKGIQSIGTITGSLTEFAAGLEVARLQTTVVIIYNGEPRVFDVIATFQRPNSILAETPIELAYTAMPRDARPGQQPIRGRLPATLGVRP